ncbi:substrate-binding domain-containing protein [Mesobacillus foraminis]|uniref:substrate-binding domain-containing protein n=1 Tax=Mesobacillus foraminis TaxID=279826 RepID=UPI001BEB2926|nr:substrate-binding domain-containing protein [Mesobacillus foraminis]MBT2758099.1 substrate-binding domain-containing protein [Mesobacillus foraminis]
MKKLLFIYAILIGVFTIFLLKYDFNSPDGGSSPMERGLGGDLEEKYVMVTFQAGIDYWKTALKGFEDAANSLNVSVEYRGATHYDVHEQITVLEQVIARKPDGIAISAIDPEKITATINKAADSGIPVVLFDSGAPGSKASSFVGTDNYNAGVIGAEKLADLIGSKGKVGIISLPHQHNHQERIKGFQETITRKFPQIEVTGIKDGKGNELVSKQAALELLEEHPDIKGIFVTEANGGVGTGNAILSSNIKDKVEIVSFDADKETLDMIKDGTISATLAQGTWNMGYWSLQYLFHLKHSLTASSKLNIASTPPLPPKVDTGVTVVTKENVGDFYAR